MKKALVWFRKDLRLDDNPALNFAAENFDSVHAVYIHSPREDGEWAAGGASKWWLHHSLESLRSRIQAQGGELTLLVADSSLEALKSFVKRHAVDAVFWNRRYESHTRARDEIIKKTLSAGGLEVQSFNSHLLWEPWEVSTGESRPYQVYGAFWRKVSALDAPPRPREPRGVTWAKVADGVELASLNLLPTLAWASRFPEHFAPGEVAASSVAGKFLESKVGSYHKSRDFPDLSGTSLLSPHLHFGEISIRKLWHAARDLQEKTSSSSERDNIEIFCKELAWREFAYHLLFHFPQTSTEPLRQDFKRFEWRESPLELRAWQEGRTGYPIVDAGMRQLWTTGYMHNRVRMIVASFLVKDLRISWLEGARWFWNTLVDADLASNTMGWQWAGGCGADAAPYFRVFNPTLQGEKFDREGVYVRRWVPELAKLPAKWVHKPWEAPAEILRASGVELGKTYPAPMVDHKQARLEALEAFSRIKSQKTT